MRNLEHYIQFCKRFNKYKIPKLKFKEINQKYINLYRINYGIYENDINKANFIIFSLSFFIFVLLSSIFTSFNLLIIISYSAIISLVLSYKFSLVLYNEINKDESIINAMLYIIKIYFSLIQKTSRDYSDHCISFIELIKDYDLPISKNFKDALIKIQEGEMPEKELLKIITPSEDFNNYVKELLVNNFNLSNTLNEYTDSSLEKKFRIYLRQIQSKISILFFSGLFFPIGLCFLIIFQLIDLLFLMFFIPFFLIFLNLLFRKFIRKNSFMLGEMYMFSNLEKKKFEEFLLYLKIFAYNLKSNISPERAFLISYMKNQNLFKLLEQPLKNQMTQLLNFSYSFREIIKILKYNLKSMRYNIILDAIEKFVNENAYYSSEKILDILTIIYKHQKLEQELDVIVKGEKFKILFFIFLLPLLTGIITGIVPFFALISLNPNLNDLSIINDFQNLSGVGYNFMNSFILLSTISISSYYFLKIINYRKKFFVISISNLLFIFCFLISFTSVVNFI